MLPPRGSGLKKGLDLTSLGMGDSENPESRRMGGNTFVCSGNDM